MDCRLLGDGSSDDALLHIIEWTINQHYPSGELTLTRADWRLFSPKKFVRERIEIALTHFPCDILFVHRDAEGHSHESRVNEIQKAIDEISEKRELPPVICVVPVKMTEAWFLFDEAEPSIRRAAGKPRGKTTLSMPGTAHLEQLSDPKTVMYDLLRTASETPRHRLHSFKESERFRRVAEQIEDFSPLRRLSAFRAFETELQSVINRIGQ